MTTNYEKYFGSPEKASKTVYEITSLCQTCDGGGGCPIADQCKYDGGKSLLEWIQEECDD